MMNLNLSGRKWTQRLAGLVLVLCLVLSTIPALASGSSSITPSSEKTFVLLKNSIVLFTGETYGKGTVASCPSGTVLQMVSPTTYTGTDALVYACVYYNSVRYNVLYTNISSSIMTSDELTTYIKTNIWTQTSFTTLKKSMNLVGDVRVYSLQLALKELGFYTGSMDGNYGAATQTAVKKFQKAHSLTADGSAGALTLPVIYQAALNGGSSSGSSSSSSSSSTTEAVTSTGKLTTISSVNLRQSASTKSPRLTIVNKGLTLSYSATETVNGIVWYKVAYGKLTGWLMGTFVKASASSSTTAIGTGTITKKSTIVRTTPNGDKSGIVLAKGAKVSVLAEAVSAGNYDWYYIRTSANKVGYVRSDCINTTIGGSGSGTVVPVGSVTFIKLPNDTTVFTTTTYSTGGFQVSAGTVVQLRGTYTEGGTQYAQIYYNSKAYNTLYSAVKSGIMTSDALSTYVKALWGSSLTSSLKSSLNLVGDIRVYALQCALNSLGYYSGTLDGNYGTATVAAVRNFQRAVSLTVDGACGTKTWAKLQEKLNTGSGSGSVVVQDFGTVKKVVKASWTYDDNGASLFPKGTYATVMDVSTGKVFKVYRWSGGNHADCVPATSADTKTMCDIVGFTYNSNHPTSAQLAKIKADGNSSTVTYTWPDFKASFGGTAKNIGSAWDRRAALLNVDGTVYCVSIYGFPHGFTGTDSFSKSKFPSGDYFYEVNNFYGMICIHFVGSKTHSGTAVDSKHQANITTAYNYAKSLWPKLCQ